MCVDLCDRENKSEPARRKFTFPIEAYADRIRLKARLELASSEPAMIMFDILAKKRVPLVKATNAVRETLDSATNTGYATQRLENLDMLRKQRLVLLDELISKFSAFVDAISKLPPKIEHIAWRPPRIAENNFAPCQLDADVGRNGIQRPNSYWRKRTESGSELVLNNRMTV
jgi:hypothetical protein